VHFCKRIRSRLMADRHHNIRTIETYRMLTEERVQHLLDNVENAASLDSIKKLIYDFERDGSRSYLLAMLKVFRFDNIEDVDQDTLQVIQDAWNYFPHRFLNGRCPAEVMEELRKG
jgi:hypothetical protein